MKALNFDIELLTPALLGRVEGEPNSSVSYNYIPGSVVRGALINRFARQSNVPAAKLLDDPKTQTSVQRLFFGGARFLNAHPADRRGNRAVPAPQSWRRSKAGLQQAAEGVEYRVPIYDFALEGREDEQYQRVDAPFCWVESESRQVRLVSLRRRVMVHTQRATTNRNLGRPRDGDGAVYRYESLDTGQTFVGVILCDDTDVAVFEPLLHGEYRLGKAHTAGYGHARFRFKRTDAEWREIPDRLAEGNSRLIVTLTSPLLLRDARGQFSVDAGALAHQVGRALNAGVVLERPFVSAEVVGGFNRKWGLPLPQMLAFSSGSTLVLKLEGRVSAGQLRALEEHGLGERCIDGFGRLVLNWQQDAELNIEVMPESRPDPLPIEDEASRRVAERIARRRFERKLESLWLSHAAKLKVESSLSRAQLNRLRSIALNALREGQEGTKRLQDFISGVRKRQTTRERWDRAKIEVRTNERQPLLQWVESLANNLLADRAEWCQVIGVKETDLPRVQVGSNVEVSLSADQQAAFSLRLLAEVLKRAAKESRQRGRE